MQSQIGVLDNRTALADEALKVLRVTTFRADPVERRYEGTSPAMRFVDMLEGGRW